MENPADRLPNLNWPANLFAMEKGNDTREENTRATAGVSTAMACRASRIESTDGRATEAGSSHGR